MIDRKTFIRNLGDKAADFFNTKPTTVARWLKTGSIPFKALEKIDAAVEASQSVAFQEPAPINVPQMAVPIKATEPEVDPLTHLPSNLDRRLPQIQAAPGHAPQVIEMSPTEQNWGVNLTRPGRVTGPMPPMKIRKVDGQDVPYVEQPAPIKNLPPEMGDGGVGWNAKGPPIPQPKRENERAKPQEPTESVSTETLP